MLDAVQSHHRDVLSMLRLALYVFDESHASLQRVVDLLEQMLDLHLIPSSPGKRSLIAPGEDCLANWLILRVL